MQYLEQRRKKARIEMNRGIFVVLILIAFSLSVAVNLLPAQAYSATTGKEVWIFVDNADSLGYNSRILCSVVEGLTG